MKLLRNCSLVVLAFFGLTAALTAADLGDPVAALWSDGHYYTGRVIEVRGQGEYKVLYDDGDKKVVNGSQLRVLRDRNFKVGEKVYASEKGARMHGGTVIEVKPNRCVIQWNDGSKPSGVPNTRIIPK